MDIQFTVLVFYDETRSDQQRRGLMVVTGGDKVTRPERSIYYSPQFSVAAVPQCVPPLVSNQPGFC